MNAFRLVRNGLCYLLTVISRNFRTLDGYLSFDTKIYSISLTEFPPEKWRHFTVTLSTKTRIKSYSIFGTSISFLPQIEASRAVGARRRVSPLRGGVFVRETIETESYFSLMNRGIKGSRLHLREPDSKLFAHLFIYSFLPIHKFTFRFSAIFALVDFNLRLIPQVALRPKNNNKNDDEKKPRLLSIHFNV